MAHRPAGELTRSTLQILALGLLIVTSFWILQPFLAALTWATTIVVATWPLLLALEGAMGGRRGPAAATMTALLLMLVLVPLILGTTALVSHGASVVEWTKSLAAVTIPPPPPWLASIPVVGAKAAARWSHYASLTHEEIAAQLAPYGQAAALWIAAEVGSIALVIGQFLLTAIIAAVLYVQGEAAAAEIERFTARLAGEQGIRAAHLAAQAVRGVALGVVVTALLQTAMVAAGFLVAGIPFAAILIAVCFVLSIAQIGPVPVLIGAVIWVWMNEPVAWFAVFLGWCILCALVDNVVRPVLIRRGADLPLALIFIGVIGGLLAMGVLGLFVGPVVLAVSWTLLDEWLAAGEAATGATSD
ncbi:MAG TPA: AI-2E family transporter [Candidatus Binatia bacterium]|jgi:predicted PurR-regulated permease PerM